MPAYDTVKMFEREVATYANAPLAVAVSSCTNALFLCCKYLNVKWVHIPKETYPGVACSIINAGGKACFIDDAWSGIYKLRPYDIYDSALRFQRNMYIRGSLYCVSFHAKKHLPIGRGGMILLDDERAYRWLKRARFDGRGEIPLSEDRIPIVGYNMYMTPDQAARGMMLLDMICDRDPNVWPKQNDLSVDDQHYPDLSKVKAYQWKK